MPMPLRHPAANPPTTTPSLQGMREPSRRRGPAAATRIGTGVELVLGAVLLGAATLAGLFFVRRPWPNRLDTFGFTVLPADYSAGWAHELTHFGSVTALVVGAIVVFAVGATRDWVRGLACAVGPLLAVLIVQEVAKPLVDRHVNAFGGASYPSGTVTAVTALATAAVLVTPRLLRWLTAAGGVLFVGATCAAVVVLRWHFPTDALGGICVGAGAVLLVDALFHVPWALRAPARLRPVWGTR
jgi:membrane-associated phospholipid phosphatase